MTAPLEDLPPSRREDLHGPLVTSANCYWDLHRAAWVLTSEHAPRPDAGDVLGDESSTSTDPWRSVAVTAPDGALVAARVWLPPLPGTRPAAAGPPAQVPAPRSAKPEQRSPHASSR